MLVKGLARNRHSPRQGQNSEPMKNGSHVVSLKRRGGKGTYCLGFLKHFFRIRVRGFEFWLGLVLGLGVRGVRC